MKEKNTQDFVVKVVVPQRDLKTALGALSVGSQKENLADVLLEFLADSMMVHGTDGTVYIAASIPCEVFHLVDGATKASVVCSYPQLYGSVSSASGDLTLELCGEDNSLKLNWSSGVGAIAGDESFTFRHLDLHSEYKLTLPSAEVQAALRSAYLGERGGIESSTILKFNQDGVTVVGTNGLCLTHYQIQAEGFPNTIMGVRQKDLAKLAKALGVSSADTVSVAASSGRLWFADENVIVAVSVVGSGSKFPDYSVFFKTKPTATLPVTTDEIGSLVASISKSKFEVTELKTDDKGRLVLSGGDYTSELMVFAEVSNSGKLPAFRYNVRDLSEALAAAKAAAKDGEISVLDSGILLLTFGQLTVVIAPMLKG